MGLEPRAAVLAANLLSGVAQSALGAGKIWVNQKDIQLAHFPIQILQSQLFISHLISYLSLNTDLIHRFT